MRMINRYSLVVAASLVTMAGSSRAASPPTRLRAVSKIVAIGDLHGDLAATRRVLRLAGAIDARDRWVGGRLVVVQTGDQIDRGPADRAILDLLDRLHKAARRAGGAVWALNGNHELMNVAGDFRYVTPTGFRTFVGLKPKRAQAARVDALPERQRGRAAAFFPAGLYARRLAVRPVVLQIGDSVFAHGGVHPKHVRYGLARLNRETAAWLRGTRAKAPSVLDEDDSPVWTRAFGGKRVGAAACKALASALRSLKAKRLVVGHTVQEGGVSSACGGKVWRIDVGLARYYGSAPAQALEITAAGTRVLRATARKRSSKSK